MGKRPAIGTGVLKRRGLLAGAAGLAAGLVAKLAGPEGTDAAHDADVSYSSQALLHADQTTMPNNRTTMQTVQTVESFGGSTLSNGQATIALDEVAAATIEGEYHVFLSEGGDSNGLYVADKGPKGFTVREKKGGTSGIPFSYRVVAKRKAPDRPRIVMPKDVPVPTPPTLPEVPKGEEGRPNAR